MEPVKKLPDSEMKLMELIWDSEPVRSGELVSMSLEKHGWKKSTVYTILKKLVNKGFAINEDSVITLRAPGRRCSPTAPRRRSSGVTAVRCRCS